MMPRFFKINKMSFLTDWESLNFDFFQTDQIEQIRPDIVVSNVGMLAFSNEARNILFSKKEMGLEFLSIIVDCEEWWLLNCLNVISDVDTEKSEFIKILGREIVYIVKLYAAIDASKGNKFFTLEQSNRAQIIVTNEFCVAVERAGLKGISFKKIGELI